MYRELNQDLLNFLYDSPTSFHAVNNIRTELLKNDYVELQEGNSWKLQEGGKYFCVRNESSIIAFQIPTLQYKGFMIAASHCDSPTFKIKENPEIVGSGYVKLNIEKYGGMLCAPWFDRPLSVAGRIVVKEGEKFLTKLVNIDHNLLMIPNIAIHLNREANSGMSYNVQNDMLPILGDESCKGQFMSLIAKSANVAQESILGHDLFLYTRDKGTVWGMDEEYISSGRLDDLQCSYTDMRAFIDANPTQSIPVLAIFDNEEVGSGTKQGADSTFLVDCLKRIHIACNHSEESYFQEIAHSFMISADNAHAVHPNHPEKSDPVNRPSMNQGIVIKFNANQKYTTDAVSAAIFKGICEREEVPYQEFTNRSDMIGGSTLGNISNAHVSLNTVDIGLAQLAMHSPYETAGSKDTEYLYRVMKCFFSSSLTQENLGNYRMR